MTWVFIGIVVLVVAAVATVAVGRGAGLSVAQPDRPEVALPADRMLTGADLDAVGLSVGLRGYRMDEVDDLLARLAAEVDERDRILAEYAGSAGEPGDAVSESPATSRAATSPAATAPAASSPEVPAAVGPGGSADPEQRALDAAAVPARSSPGDVR